MKWSLAALCCASILAFSVVGYFVLRKPEPCSVQPITGNWSNANGFRATLLEKVCGDGGWVSYSIKVEKIEATPSGGWYFVWDIDNDKSDAKPSVQWETPTRLRLDVPTKRLSGR